MFGISDALAQGAQETVGTAKKLIDLVLETAVKYGFQVLGGLVILLIGWFVANFTAKLVKNFLAKQNIDVTVSKFLVGIAKLVVMAFAAIAALGKFGIEITPLIAGLSVAGVGVSFALQGTLSNYAAGTSLIFTKPFKVGEIIEVAGVVGEVKDISLGSTELIRVDGARVVIPNKHIIGEIIHNYSHLKGMDIKVGIGYDSDLTKAIRIIEEVIRREKRVPQDKPPKVGITEFADSSITLEAKIWCKQADYLDVLFGINKGILEEFSRQGIAIPFPQRDVHLYQQKETPRP